MPLETCYSLLVYLAPAVCAPRFHCWEVVSFRWRYILQERKHFGSVDLTQIQPINKETNKQKEIIR